MTIHQN